VEAFPPLWPQAGERGSGIRGVLLTGADLDYTLGLILLREGGRLIVYAPPTVRAALDEGLQLSRLLERFCGLEWRAPPDNFASLTGPDGSTSGLSYAAFPVPGKPPGHSRDPTAADEVIGYRIVDDATGGRLVYVPGLAVLSPAFRARAADCDLLLLDGTFWSDDEMTAGGFGPQTARAMGHLPVGGPDGTLAFVAQLPPGRVVYVHVNNTNPMLKEDSPQRPAVTAAGAEVGYDGQEFTL
jgi:pyrroloquinoline quinone biosynthesis protein B